MKRLNVVAITSLLQIVSRNTVSEILNCLHARTYSTHLTHQSANLSTRVSLKFRGHLELRKVPTVILNVF